MPFRLHRSQRFRIGPCRAFPLLRLRLEPRRDPLDRSHQARRERQQVDERREPHECRNNAKPPIVTQYIPDIDSSR